MGKVIAKEQISQTYRADNDTQSTSASIGAGMNTPLPDNSDKATKTSLNISIETPLNNCDDVVDMLLNRFYENFAERCSEAVIKHGRVDDIYEIATGKYTGSASSRQQQDTLLFRSAYILETLFFMDAKLFSPYVERFFDDFSKTKSESAKRHFSKMMFHLLRNQQMQLVSQYTQPTYQQCETIAETCISWATNSRVRPAVKIWCIEVLFKLRKRVDWLSDVLPEIIEAFSYDTKPSMASRMKRWQKKINR